MPGNVGKLQAWRKNKMETIHKNSCPLFGAGLTANGVPNRIDGGPELFTFDNHDPKGGLVRLNDGTVRFIRTEEELKRLRWK